MLYKLKITCNVPQNKHATATEVDVSLKHETKSIVEMWQAGDHASSLNVVVTMKVLYPVQITKYNFRDVMRGGKGSEKQTAQAPIYSETLRSLKRLASVLQIVKTGIYMFEFKL